MKKFLCFLALAFSFSSMSYADDRYPSPPGGGYDYSCRLHGGVYHAKEYRYERDARRHCSRLYDIFRVRSGCKVSRLSSYKWRAVFSHGVHWDHSGRQGWGDTRASLYRDFDRWYEDLELYRHTDLRPFRYFRNGCRG